jgi:Lrp/AsnC family leucine-responsive transcriptional regulator
MDEVDKKIVKILKNNSKTTLQNISEKINLSIAPTARRINQLEENNIIKNYSINIDETFTWLQISCIYIYKLRKTTIKKF